MALAVWGCSGESRTISRGSFSTGGSVSGEAGGTATAGTSAAPGDGDGQGGRAGAPSDSPSVAVVDDMDHTDDGYPNLPSGSGFWWGPPDAVHLGNWFVSSAGRATTDASIEEIDPPRGQSTRACHVAGANFETGVDLSAELDHPQHRAVDVSAYTGFTFWVKLASPSRNLTVAISTGARYFDAQTNMMPLPSRTLTVSDAWQEIVLTFDEFNLESSDVASIDFVAGEGGEPFDLWVDDLAFLCRGPC
jgi:hypothetical protein